MQHINTIPHLSFALATANDPTATGNNAATASSITTNEGKTAGDDTAVNDITATSDNSITDEKVAKGESPAKDDKSMKGNDLIKGEASAKGDNNSNGDDPAKSKDLANGDDLARSENADLISLRRELTEAVERLITSTGYSELNLHADAEDDQPSLIAESIDEIFQTRSIMQLATSHIRLTFDKVDNYVIDPKGHAFPYRGRGPIWWKNSCWLDSIICCARLLDAGLTCADRGEDGDWRAKLSPTQLAFLNILNTDWDFYDHEESVRRRNEFWELYANSEETKDLEIRVGVSDKVPDSWRLLTNNFHQFNFQVQDSWDYDCSCSSGDILDSDVIGCLAPPMRRGDGTVGVGVETLFARCFEFMQICSKCKKRTKKRRKTVVGDLPLRLALTPEPLTVLLEHTSSCVDVKFRSINGESEVDQVAQYRWLGGIYHKEMAPDANGDSVSHFRVYWNDAERGEDSQAGYLRVYDSIKAGGAIIGEVKPFSKEELIPESWRKSTPSLLFYERLINPDLETIDTAGVALASVDEWIKQGLQFFQQHRRWSLTPFYPSIKVGGISNARVSSRATSSSSGSDAEAPRSSNDVTELEGASSSLGKRKGIVASEDSQASKNRRTSGSTT